MFPDLFSVTSRLFVVLLAATLATAGCSESSETAPEATDPPVEEPPVEEPDDPGPAAIVASRKARVKFKGGERFARDLSASLELPRGALCNELGQYDCVGDVHRIALGGVEPYELGIDEPLAVAPVSAAIAADRVALTACTARVSLDFDDPASAVLFAPLAAETVERGALEGVAADLVDRILRRDATPDEVKALADFWSDVQAEADDPPRAWGQLACFSVATMLESLFY